MSPTASQPDAPTPRRRLRRRDRLLAATVAGRLGRGVSFSIDLAAAIRRGLRGEFRDPEERRYE